MDPVSIIASIAGIATAGTALSKAIYQFISSTRGASREMGQIAHTIVDLSIILGELRRVLRDGAELCNRKFLRRINPCNHDKKGNKAIEPITHQSLVDLSETQDQYLNIDAEKPNHLSSDQKNEAVSQLQLQVSRQRSDDTADWLFDLVFLPYAQSCVDPSDQNSTNLPSNSTMSDIDEDPQEQSSTNECSTGKSAVIRDPSAMQIALYNPGAASSLVKELLADWTVLTEKEIESVTSDSQSSEQEEAKTSNESEKTKEFIYFEDAVGRRYTFPFYRVKSYQGLKTLIESAFHQVDVVGPHVMAGRFDIIGSHSAIGPNAALEKDGKIILPEVWEDFIQPGMAVAMAMGQWANQSLNRKFRREFLC
ncbi:hypothetical protein AUP68_07788 [Ilyonectria robusta]